MGRLGNVTSWATRSPAPAETSNVEVDPARPAGTTTVTASTAEKSPAAPAAAALADAASVAVSTRPPDAVA